ncbi:MAG: group I intron-associated PD-(D/E)XK endonuclease [Pseudomonadota bacterium]
MVDPSIAIMHIKNMHHTKQKGDLGVLKAQLDLFEQGFLILDPLTEHAPFDLVAYKDKKFLRIQVKYKSVDKTGSITVHFRSCWADKNGTHMHAVDKKEIDIYCVYCPDTDECYYFNPSEFNRSVTLRVEAPKNNQTRKVKLVSDYRRVP